MGTIEANELVLWGTNDGTLYRTTTQPIIANLKKHMARGNYDAEKAMKLWQHLADRAAQRYTAENDHRPDTSFGAFNKPTRQEAAKGFARYYADHLED